MDESEKESAGQPFLSRWSQRKHETTREQAATTPPAAAAQSPAPVLPPVEQLTMASDFSGFLHPEVDEGLRRAALRKLFSDPHFNVMDGLDTYVDDYSQPNPLPAAMLAGLRQAQNIFAWAAETPEQTAARFAPPPCAAAAAAPDAGAVLPDSESAPRPVTEQTTTEASPPAPAAEAVERKS